MLLLSADHASYSWTAPVYYRRGYDIVHGRRECHTITDRSAEQTIPGLEEVVIAMKEGDRLASVMVPTEKAFGAGGNPHGFHG